MDNNLLVLTQNSLVVSGDLYWESLDAFVAAGDKLLAMPDRVLTLDFSKTSFMSSSFVGAIGTFIVRAVRRRKKVIIRSSLDVCWLFEIMGSRNMFEMEIV
ncbi:MAG: hypothetical protein LBJ46_11715 [Planctomycetota bacterium]|nr:hypothetical protein [Planctomycetota bacterium]